MQSVYTALIPAARERESRQGIFDITIRPRLISFALFFLIRFYTTCLIPLQRVSVCFFFFASFCYYFLFKCSKQKQKDKVCLRTICRTWDVIEQQLVPLNFHGVVISIYIYLLENRRKDFRAHQFVNQMMTKKYLGQSNLMLDIYSNAHLQASDQNEKHSHSRTMKLLAAELNRGEKKDRKKEEGKKLQKTFRVGTFHAPSTFMDLGFASAPFISSPLVFLFPFSYPKKERAPLFFFGYFSSFIFFFFYLRIDITALYLISFKKCRIF